MTNHRLYLSIFLSFCCLTTIISQTNPDTSGIDLSIGSLLGSVVSPSIFSISGDVGTFWEMYSTSKDVKRRPNSTGRIFIRPTFRFFENFSVSFDLFLSTEGSGTRQQINRIAISPDWGWGKVHIGDFNHRFSKYTLNGINIRGGGIEINPGIFRFQVIGGQSRRAVVAGPFTSVYAQHFGAVKIGIGRKNGSFFDINIFRAKDDISSVPSNIFIVDSTGNTGKPQVGVSPQENLVVGFNTDLKIIKNMLRLRGEFSGSLFTNDMFASDLVDKDIPEFVDNYFKIRKSTNLDYAYYGILDFKYDVLNVSLKYETINPGYNSLGLMTITNDKRKYGTNIGLRLFKNLLMLQLTFDAQNDNLLKQKDFTLDRKTYGLNLVVRPMNSLSISLNTIQNRMENDSANDTLKIDNKILTISSNINYQFAALALNHSLSVGHSFQLSESKNIFAASDVNVNNIFANWNIMISPSWSFMSGFTLVIVDASAAVKTQTMTYNFRINNSMFNSHLNNALTVSYANSDLANVLHFNLQSSFRITRSDIIKLKARYSTTSYKNSTTPDFWENIVSLNLVHRL